MVDNWRLSFANEMSSRFLHVIDCPPQSVGQRSRARRTLRPSHDQSFLTTSLSVFFLTENPILPPGAAALGSE